MPAQVQELVVDNLLLTLWPVSEAIGLALPYSSGTPAPYLDRDKYALESGTGYEIIER